MVPRKASCRVWVFKPSTGSEMIAWGGVVSTCARALTTVSSSPLESSSSSYLSVTRLLELTFNSAMPPGDDESMPGDSSPPITTLATSFT